MWLFVTGCGKTAEQRADERRDAGILAVCHALGMDVGMLVELHGLRATPRSELDDLRAVTNDLGATAEVLSAVSTDLIATVGALSEKVEKLCVILDCDFLIHYAPMVPSNEAETGIDRPDTTVMASNEAETETGTGVSGSERGATGDVPAMSPNEEDSDSGRESIVEALSDVGVGVTSPSLSLPDGNLKPIAYRNRRERLALQTKGDVKVILKATSMAGSIGN
jgi:hypothetical protein